MSVKIAKAFSAGALPTYARGGATATGARSIAGGFLRRNAATGIYAN